MGRGRRTGFTLVELLVVIAIIGILVALLLPAVQSTREAARRMQCQNNLKQIGLALHNYHDTYKSFPPGVVFDAGEKPETSDKFRPNWVIMMLPFFEQQPLHDSFNFQVYISDVENRESRSSVLPSFLCPTDKGPETPFMGTSAEEGDNWGRGNYAANAHNDRLQLSLDWNDVDRRGVMGFNKSLRIAQIQDGTSHTMLVSEIRIGLVELDRRGTWAMGTAGASALFWHGFSGDANGPNAANDRSDDIEGCDKFYDSIGASRLMKMRMSCWRPCPSWQATSRSLHRNGVQIVLADGSVHFITDAIETSGEFGPCCALWDRFICSGDGFPIDLSEVFP